mgnify:CR=1 FL=1
MSKKTNAAILIIGNEILSGRTQDTNTSTLSLWLNSIGVKVQEVRVIPDIEQTIVDSVNSLRKIYDYIFTTGGIGPTHDDITAQSIAKAFKLNYELHEEGYKILESYYEGESFTYEFNFNSDPENNLIVNYYGADLDRGEGYIGSIEGAKIEFLD